MIIIDLCGEKIKINTVSEFVLLSNLIQLSSINSCKIGDTEIIKQVQSDDMVILKISHNDQSNKITIIHHRKDYELKDHILLDNGIDNGIIGNFICKYSDESGGGYRISTYNDKCNIHFAFSLDECGNVTKVFNVIERYPKITKISDGIFQIEFGIFGTFILNIDYTNILNTSVCQA